MCVTWNVFAALVCFKSASQIYWFLLWTNRNARIIIKFYTGDSIQTIRVEVIQIFRKVCQQENASLKGFYDNDLSHSNAFALQKFVRITYIILQAFKIKLLTSSHCCINKEKNLKTLDAWVSCWKEGKY